MSSGFNYAETLDQAAVSRGNHPALIHGGESLTHADFAALVRRASNILIEDGVQKGDLVGLGMRDSVEYVALMFALARIGAITLPVDARWQADEKRRMVAFFKPRILLSDEPVAEIVECPVVVVDSDWKRRLQTAANDAPIVRGTDTDMIVSLSSGTTGRPTGPLLTHEQMFARTVSQMASLGFSSYDRFMTATPLYFGGGRAFTLSQIAIGATLILNTPPFKIEELARAVRETRTTALFLVPTLLRRLLELPDEELTGFRHLRQLISSGSPLHAHERVAVRERLTRNYYEYYASTEGGGVSVLAPEDQVDHPDTVGRPAFRVDLQVVGDDHQPLPAGETGSVRYRGPGVAQWFFRDDEAAAKSFRDGFFYPGDLGVLDEEGFLSLKGRSKDVIIRGGVNIYPAEIERVVSAVAGVSECCVFPVPHATFGEEVGVALVLASGMSEDATREAIRVECAVKLASYKHPKHVFFMDSFPKNSGGKVVKAEVLKAVLD
ncbi:class I adenylate-forming enzyme family protein [Oceanibacterium hippocampi]|uniref:Long-chain-fatty-acid--CoA ligase FadD13 n=1 Tax=Oceanibacterium hippocampi TaxID=745714 RepID=A0A1Y5TW56_9PROT|nr:AMP-binding protein [Oceanibacterium hippocampi]SLN71352.1 Long-chain-fatty-acid--CoA ligase FadD13 [Oceanibacterium hippocampi]